jgi:hypothetical protein
MNTNKGDFQMFKTDLIEGGIKKLAEARAGLIFLLPILGEVLLDILRESRSEKTELPFTEIGNVTYRAHNVRYRIQFGQQPRYSDFFEIEMVKVEGCEGEETISSFYRATFHAGNDTARQFPKNGMRSEVLAWQALLLIMSDLSDQVLKIKEIMDAMEDIGKYL